mmetsp:Transcript_9971/g.40376  ORF Transcript_9971/g.40376 Transcript_9971/m.40376 type:complete len:224 (+) Transcript_9971:1067-1738(+)
MGEGAALLALAALPRRRLSQGSHCAELDEGRLCSSDGLRLGRLWRRVEELGHLHARGLDAAPRLLLGEEVAGVALLVAKVLVRPAEDDLHLEVELVQRRPLDLRQVVGGEAALVSVPRVEAQADARLHAAGAARPLLGAGARDAHLAQGRHAALGIVGLLLGLARVDDVEHVRDGDGGLGNVRADHHLPLAGRRRLENLLLRRAADRRVQRQHPELAGHARPL